MKFKKLLLLIPLFLLVGCGASNNGNQSGGDTRTHTFASEWSHDDTYHWHAATCEHTNETKDKAEHTWNDGEITTQPTQEADGVKTYTCTVCGHTKTEKVDKLEQLKLRGNKFIVTSIDEYDDYPAIQGEISMLVDSVIYFKDTEDNRWEWTMFSQGHKIVSYGAYSESDEGATYSQTGVIYYDPNDETHIVEELVPQEVKNTLLDIEIKVDSIVLTTWLAPDMPYFHINATLMLEE